MTPSFRCTVRLASQTETYDPFAATGEPKRLGMIAVANGGFSDNLTEFDSRLADALGWVSDHSLQ